MNLDECCSILIYGRPGSGKTNIVKYLLNRIEYKHLHIITSSPYNYDMYDTKDCVMTFDYDIGFMNEFLSKKGIKVVVLDDFLHLNFNGKVGQSLKSLLSTTRHTQTYILIATQLLTTIGKAFRLCAKVFLTAQIDEDSIKLTSMLSGEDKKTLAKIKLQKYQFLLVEANGNPIRAITIKLTEDNDKDPKITQKK